MSKAGFAMALHGGAGARRGRDYAREIDHMRGLIEAGRDRLASGASAMDVVVETVCALEDSGLYVAGRGASPNASGVFELDAGLMDCSSGRAGAVAAWVSVQAAGEAVGCVVRDMEGRLAAATSTGGVFNKLPGRVGDTPIIGAGVFADHNVAVSCTGQGEYFIRVAAAAQVAFRIRLAGQSVADAAQAVLDEIAGLGGDGGMICVDAAGQIAMPFASQGMKRAALHLDGRMEAEAF